MKVEIKQPDIVMTLTMSHREAVALATMTGLGHGGCAGPISVSQAICDALIMAGVKSDAKMWNAQDQHLLHEWPAQYREDPS